MYWKEDLMERAVLFIYYLRRWRINLKIILNTPKVCDGRDFQKDIVQFAYTVYTRCVYDKVLLVQLHDLFCILSL